MATSVEISTAQAAGLPVSRGQRTEEVHVVHTWFQQGRATAGGGIDSRSVDFNPDPVRPLLVEHPRMNSPPQGVYKGAGDLSTSD